MESVYRNLFMH